jgi:hypothetical protein
MSSTPLHRHRSHSSSLYLAVISGAASIVMAAWGLSILGGH